MLQRPDDFRTNMEKALALNQSDGSAYYHLGRFYYEKKQYKEALERLDKAAELDSENYKAYYFSGLCRQAGAEDEKAGTDFRKAIDVIERKKIRYGWPFADLGELMVQGGEFEKGLSWIYRATRNDPSLPYTHFVYARALLRNEESLEAEQALQQAIKLDPGYTEAYYLLARYYTKTGDQERAKRAFAKFEELRKNPVPSAYGLRR
jgi:tetratricopeptide (TPR) repeat protein